MTFKPGDIVQLIGYSGEVLHPIAVVRTPLAGMSGTSVSLRGWLDHGEQWVLDLDGTWEICNTRPHPDPDAAWAEYIAAQLTD